MLDPVSERYKEALRRGHSAVVKGRPREAIEHYAEAGRLVSDRPLPFVRMGSVFLQMRQPQEAVAAFEQALERAPDDPEAIRGKAHALEAAGRADESSQLLRRADELDAMARAGEQARLARAATAMGIEGHFRNAVAARDAGDRVVAVQAFMATAHGYLGQGSFDAAFDACLRALEVDPGALPAHVLLVDMDLRRGWTTSAVERMQLLDHRLRVEPDPGASAALGALAAHYREADPAIDRLAGDHG